MNEPHDPDFASDLWSVPDMLLPQLTLDRVTQAVARIGLTAEVPGVADGEWTLVPLGGFYGRLSSPEPDGALLIVRMSRYGWLPDSELGDLLERCNEWNATHTSGTAVVHQMQEREGLVLSLCVNNRFPMGVTDEQLSSIIAEAFAAGEDFFGQAAGVYGAAG